MNRGEVARASEKIRSTLRKHRVVSVEIKRADWGGDALGPIGLFRNQNVYRADLDRSGNRKTYILRAVIKRKSRAPNQRKLEVQIILKKPRSEVLIVKYDLRYSGSGYRGVVRTRQQINSIFRSLRDYSENFSPRRSRNFKRVNTKNPETMEDKILAIILN